MKSYKARGIVLHTLKYGDSSMVVQMLTDTHGRQSYMVQGVRSTRGRGSKMALLQPLFAVEYEGLESPRMELHRLRELHSGILLRTLPYDVRKSTIALFIAEVLYRLIEEREANEPLFEFVWSSIEALDAMQEGVANFHLWFLANLCGFLGFHPGNNYHAHDYFDMREGLFSAIMPLHDNALTPEYAALFADLLDYDVASLASLTLNRQQRVEMLSRLVEYYSLHLDNISRVRSIGILQEVF